MEYWPHQDRTDALIDSAIEAGHKRILVTGPTGSGKSVMILRRIEKAKRSVLYTHRRFLREQLERNMQEAGVDFGVRASGKDPALLRDVQISSIQTEEQRVFKQKRWELHHCDVAHIDEAHVQKGKVAKKIIAAHVEDGSTVAGWTATPLDLGDYYDHLIIAATNSECRECGALVKCQTFAPDEPDLGSIRNIKIGEDLTDKDNRSAIMRPGIFGRVLKHYKRLNPEQRPAILFGPDVPGSLWFAEEFVQAGIPAAHIDGEEVWINGEVMPSNQEARDRLADASRTGEVKVVCNRFVMREGIDWPWLYHGILATVFGSLASYLQSGGRLLRSHPSLDHVLLQDHGGNWHRHGSLNEDREWALDLTGAMVTSARQERMREKKEHEPIVCPKCGKVRLSGPTCSACGHRSERRSRIVVQEDGNLKEKEGEIYRPRKVKQAANTEKLWTNCYWRAKKSKRPMSFNQAYALFFQDNGYYPPRNLPLMPTRESDWGRKVVKVPMGELIHKAQPEHQEQQRRFA